MSEKHLGELCEGLHQCLHQITESTQRLLACWDDLSPEQQADVWPIVAAIQSVQRDRAEAN